MKEVFKYHFNYELKVGEKNYIDHGLVGLTNLGNTCYLNSILQCLSNTLKLTDFFLSGDYKADITKQNLKNFEHYIIMSFNSLLSNIWESNENIITPKSFKDNLFKFIKKYYSHEQQDSHECLLYILDLLHKGLSYQIEVDISGQVVTKNDQLMKDSMEVWKKHYSDSYSVFIELFYGQYHGYISCKEPDCGHHSSTFDPFSSIQLPIENKDCKLLDCLTNYFDDHSDIDLKCEKCSKNTNRKLDFWKVPDFLIIQLKRFTNDNEKINSLVDFPLENLDLTSFISPEKQDPNKYIYNLYAINCHSGGTNGGHYYSKCKNLNGSWYIFNDENVSKYASNSNLINNDAYILFYHRVFIK